MKILLDQNISHRVLHKIRNDFPEARHVRDFNMQFCTDIEIWRFAKEHSFTLVTYDADFNDFLTLKGHPPKIIWLRFGNMLTQYLAERMNHHKYLINTFINDPTFLDVGCLEINN